MSWVLGELVRRFGGHVRLPDGMDGTAAYATGVAGVELDSRCIEVGDLFVALPGERSDGASFAPQAQAAGAKVILAPVEKDPLRALEVPLWVHPEARRLAGLVAAQVHRQPARGMFTCGITGTNGKTTTAHLARHLLTISGRKPAFFGTTGYKLAGGVSELATHTTPDAPRLQRLLERHRGAGGDSAVFEVSSHALDQDRTAGLDFDVAVFTNLTRDHLDYHADMEAYAAAKQRLFSGLDARATAVIRLGCEHAARMARAARATGARVVTYTVEEGKSSSSADLRASRLRTVPGGTHLYLEGMGITRTRLRLPLFGTYNVENAIAACAAVSMSGASPSNLLEGLATTRPAPGRLEPVPAGKREFEVYVDYAHTEDALQNTLRTLRRYLLHRDPDQALGRLIVVFGCGGDRDQGKRGPMGRAVAHAADLAIVTSDNPRGEDQGTITRDILVGTTRGKAEVVVEPDRRRAIELAIGRARSGDVLLIAGKGHETSQIIGDSVADFDDREVARELLV